MDDVDWSLLICDDCGGQFKSKRNITSHIRNIHGGANPSFTCDICSKEFREKRNLGQHIRACHQHIRSYECELCAAQYSKKSHLERHHSKIHRGIKFECDGCGKLFGEKMNLFTHITSVHQQLRPFECLLCGANYGVSSHLSHSSQAQPETNAMRCLDTKPISPHTFSQFT